MAVIKIYPYKMESTSGRMLANSLEASRIRVEGSTYRHRVNHLIINWGNKREASWSNPLSDSMTMNTPNAIAIASSKRRSFSHFIDNNVNTPSLTTSYVVARSWFDDGITLLGRDLDNGSGGRGITIYNPNDDNEDSAFSSVGGHLYYTKYIKKRREFRIHLGYETLDRSGSPLTLLVQEKKRRSLSNRDQEEYNPYIRNYTNEWIFAHNDLQPVPASVVTQARQALDALGLHFGAVDVIYNEYRNASYVLEVNTACGMEGETLTRYSDYFRRVANSI